MAACVCIYLLNAALHHAGATALGECFGGLDRFKEGDNGVCSACCFMRDGSFSHCCGERVSAGDSNTCDDATAVTCVEHCNNPTGCCGRAGCTNRHYSCCPYPGEFS